MTTRPEKAHTSVRVPHPDRFWFAINSDMPWLGDPDVEDDRQRWDDRDSIRWELVGEVVQELGTKLANREYRAVEDDGSTVFERLAPREAVVDVLIPRHLGERAAGRRGVTGGTTIAAPASQQALDRSETVEVQTGTASGSVNRPTILGSLIGKAGALTIVNDPLWQRHIDDFLTLASVISARDLRGVSCRKAPRV